MTATAEHPTPALQPFGGCLVIANPAAAGVRDGVVERVEAALRRSRLLAGGSVETAWTQAPGQAADLAAASPAGLVVVVGGDGTVNETLPGLSAGARRDRVLCALPVGSGNSTARNLWGDRTWEEILELVAGADGTAEAGSPRVRHIDLIRLHEPGVLAVLGASTGFMAQVLIDAEDVDPALQGFDRYYTAALEVMGRMPDHPTRVTVDGTPLSDGPTSSVAIGGGRFRAWSFQFLPESVLDDGLLDVSTIGALAPAAVEEVAGLIPTGAHLGRPEVTYGRGRRVVVERTDGLPLVAELDGSVLPTAGPRLTAEVVPGALAALAAADTGSG